MTNTAAKPDVLKHSRIVKVRLDQIIVSASQPRSTFEREKIERLAQSISQNGLLQPLSVRRLGKMFELIAGERRLRALKLLGEEFAPCIVVNASEEQSAILSIIENIQREDLTVFEEAEGIEKLICRWGVTQSEAAERLGLSQSAVANKLRLLRLNREERDKICKNSLTERHARALVRISDEKERSKALGFIISHKLNVDQTEKYIDKLLSKEKKGSTKIVFKDLRVFINTINMAIETMRKAGVKAEAKKGETEGFIEYTIRIPKPCSAKQG